LCQTEFTEPTVLGSRAAADDSLKGLASRDTLWGGENGNSANLFLTL
jgi:hypothetical protein